MRKHTLVSQREYAVSLLSLDVRVLCPGSIRSDVIWHDIRRGGNGVCHIVCNSSNGLEVLCHLEYAMGDTKYQCM
jgi:hypothetical protein